MDHTNIGARFELPCSRCIHVAVFGSFKQAQQFTTQRISPVKICQNMSKWQSLRYTPFSNRPNLAAIVTQPFWVQMLQSPDALALMRLAAGSHSTKHHWLACWDSHASPLFHVTLFQLDLDVPALLSANGKLWLFQPSWYRHGKFTHQLPDPETQTLLHQEISRGYIGTFPNVYFREIWSRLCSIIFPYPTCWCFSFNRRTCDFRHLSRMANHLHLGDRICAISLFRSHQIWAQRRGYIMILTCFGWLYLQTTPNNHVQHCSTLKAWKTTCGLHQGLLIPWTFHLWSSPYILSPFNHICHMSMWWYV